MNLTTRTEGLLTIALILMLAAGAASAQSGENESQGMDHGNDTMMKDDDAMMDDKMEDDGDDNPLPGLAIVSSLVALGAAAWLIRRRN